jgi:hypothetical protein
MFEQKTLKRKKQKRPKKLKMSRYILHKLKNAKLFKIESSQHFFLLSPL